MEICNILLIREGTISRRPGMCLPFEPEVAVVAQIAS